MDPTSREGYFLPGIPFGGPHVRLGELEPDSPRVFHECVGSPLVPQGGQIPGLGWLPSSFHSSILVEWKIFLINLISKRSDAYVPSHFKSISLCTTLYKVCTRVLVRRLQLIVPRLIILEQGAFVNRWCITDNIILVQVFMHDFQQSPLDRALS